jgi:hypothetical protein
MRAEYARLDFLNSIAGQQYVSIWPTNLATAKLELPMKDWR